MNWQCVFGHAWVGDRCDRCGQARKPAQGGKLAASPREWCLWGRSGASRHAWRGEVCRRCGAIRRPGAHTTCPRAWEEGVLGQFKAMGIPRLEDLEAYVERELGLWLPHDWMVRKLVQRPFAWRLVPRDTPAGKEASRDYEIRILSGLDYYVLLYGNSDLATPPIRQRLLNVSLHPTTFSFAIAAKRLVEEMPPNDRQGAVVGGPGGPEGPAFHTIGEATAYVERELARNPEHFCELKRCPNCGLGWRVSPREKLPRWLVSDQWAVYTLSVSSDSEFFFITHGGPRSELLPLTHAPFFRLGPGILATQNLHALEDRSLSEHRLADAMRYILENCWPRCSEFPACFRCGTWF